MKNKNQNSSSIQYLTDEVISLLSENNILTEYRDIDLGYKKMLKPYSKGVVDKRIFGSMFSNQCNCGQVRSEGVQCPRCGSTILDDITAFKRYARIESPVYYCSELKYRQLIPWLRKSFNWKFEIASPWMQDYPGRGTKITQEKLELCQFIYIEEDNQILVTDDIDNFFECSFEGLLQVMLKHFPDKVNEFSSYINTSILVAPLIMRPPHYGIKNGERELEMHELSVVYQNIIYAIQNHYNTNFEGIDSEADKSMFRGILRRFISKSMSNISGLLKASKENVARVMQSNRISNSGRCTIVPAPDLKVDEVYIPRHLMYEASREEFIEYLKDYYQCTLEKAEFIYKSESTSKEVQSLFDKYINGDGQNDEGKYVIINRNPSLYKLNMMSCKVKLTNDYAMGIPVLLCAPFGGDFDGDTFSFYAIPKKINNFINNEMSPKNLVYYKKNLNPLFTPNHEIMHGLIIATKTILTDNPLSFDSLEDALEYKKSHREFKYQTVFFLEGKKTTIGRSLLGQYFDTDLNAYLDGLDKHLTASNVIPLYSKLDDFSNRLELIQAIQEFALLVTTISGATAPKLSELYLDIDKTKLNLIKEVEKNNLLSEKEKEVMIRGIYEEFVKEESNKVDQVVRTHIEESSRAKIQQLLSISLPQLNVGPNKKASVSDSTLINGMNSDDYLKHAIENRAIQDIKQSAVPTSGNFTRQMVFAASPYYYSEEIDEKNKGILIKKKDAEGRTNLDGTIVNKSNSEDLIRVRSIVTSSKKDDTVITQDMITDLMKYKQGSHVGIEMITSLTESLTQAGLSLKHGGSLFNLDPLSKIIAPENVTVTLTEDWILLKGKSKSYKFPKPNNFIQNFSDGNKYKKGETVGYSYHIFTPSYKMDCAIRLCEARKVTSKKKFASNDILISECYAYEDGIITYVSNDKTTKVFINDIEYRYNPNALYFLPEGTKVKKYDRICTGILDIREVVNKLNDYEETFYLFRTQFNELLQVTPELVEFLYVLIVRKVDGRIAIKKIINIIHESKSIYTTLAFENAKKSLLKIDSKGLPFIEDTMTRVLLSLLINNKIN